MAAQAANGHTAKGAKGATPGDAGSSRPDPSRTRLTAADFGLPESVPCPFCGGTETELHNAFGGQLSVSSYWCRPCRSAFEWFRRDAPAPDHS